MVTLVMSLESMIIQGLDPEGDYITNAKEKYKEK